LKLSSESLSLHWSHGEWLVVSSGMQALQLAQPSEFIYTALWVAASLTVIALCVSSLAIAAFVVTEKVRDFESG
jgi:hypothetical protein